MTNFRRFKEARIETVQARKTGRYSRRVHIIDLAPLLKANCGSARSVECSNSATTTVLAPVVVLIKGC